MEPADLNRPAPDDAQLDAWLNANAAIAPLPDHGFSQRVLRALPLRIDPAMLLQARRDAQAEAGRRAVFCAAGAAIGLIVYLLNLRGGVDLAGFWHSLGGLSFDWLEVLSTLGPMSIALASVALVYWKQLRALQQDLA